MSILQLWRTMQERKLRTIGVEAEATVYDLDPTGFDPLRGWMFYDVAFKFVTGDGSEQTGMTRLPSQLVPDSSIGARARVLYLAAAPAVCSIVELDTTADSAGSSSTVDMQAPQRSLAEDEAYRGTRTVDGVGQIECLCKSFSIAEAGKNLKRAMFEGPVLATRTSLYLVLQNKRKPPSIVGDIVGGLTGLPFSGPLAEFFVDSLVSDTGIEEECEVYFHELPIEVAGHRSMVGVREDPKVVVVPRSAVVSMEVTWFGGTKVATDNYRYLLRIGLFSYGWARSFFRQSGWIEA